jgi:hypothetical protein
VVNTPLGEHVVALRSGRDEVTCKIAVDYNTLFYAVTSIGSEGCVVSPVTHEVYTQFTARTGRMAK